MRSHREPKADNAALESFALGEVTVYKENLTSLLVLTYLAQGQEEEEPDEV